MLSRRPRYVRGNFDARMLVSECQRTENMSVLVGVTGFMDTLSLFKLAYPGRTSYRQESLVQDLLKTQYDAMAQEYCDLENKVVPVEKIKVAKSKTNSSQI